MNYNPLVAVAAPFALEPAVKYADALDRFNRHATNMMTHLYHVSENIADQREEFGRVLGEYRQAYWDAPVTQSVCTAAEGFNVLEKKTAVYTTAAHYGMNDTELKELGGWLEQFGYYAALLRFAETEFYTHLEPAKTQE